MAQETRAKWGELIPDVGLKISEFYDQGDRLYTPGIMNVVNVSSGTGAQRNFAGKTSFGEMRSFEDGDSVPTVTRHKTYNTTIVYRNYGGSVDVTKNTVEDRDFEAELNEMKDLSRSANYSKDKSGMQIFNGAFATTVVVNGYEVDLYGDAVPTASTIHPTVVPGASTQSNASATGITLGIDNYETADLALEMQNQDNGLPVTLSGRTTLVTGLTLQRTATEIAQSELTPENANNAINVFHGVYDNITSKLLDTNYGGSDTQWFLIKRGDTRLGHEVRQEKRLMSSVDPKTFTTTFTVDSRWINYVADWRGVWGSKGDGSAYSA